MRVASSRKASLVIATSSRSPGRLPAGVDDPLAQQQLAQSVTYPHQVAPGVFTGPDQVTRRLLGDRGDRDLDDLPELEQPRQV